MRWGSDSTSSIVLSTDSTMGADHKSGKGEKRLCWIQDMKLGIEFTTISL